MFSPQTVKGILETAIDSLVDNFVREPYVHRVEHSIHCELYSMLTVHRALQGLYTFAGTAHHRTSLVHKEWPETTCRPTKNNRRGNFDLVILDPASIADHPIEHFPTGHIKPAFIVEMGLNYDLEHLRQDDAKMANSEHCGEGYLVHLWQPHKGIADSKINDLKEWLSTAQSNVAAAICTSKGVWVKHLNEPALGLQVKP